MKKKLTFSMIIISLTAVLLLSACGGQETPVPTPIAAPSLDSVVAEGKILPARDLQLNFAAEGRVAEILVQEGEQVSAGQVLIELEDSEPAQAAREEAHLALISARQDLDDFLRTADLQLAQAWEELQAAQVRRAEAEREWEDLDLDRLEDEIDEAQIEVEDRQEDLEDAEEELEKYRDVAEDNLDRERAEDDLEAALEDVNEAHRLLEEAEREIDSVRVELDGALAAEQEARWKYELQLEEGNDPDQLALLEARVTAAEAQLKSAENALDNYSLRAPFDGTVTDIFLETGEFVGPYSRAILLADLSELHVESSDLTELEVVQVRIGQTVEMVPDSLPDLVLSGVVERIGDSFQTQAGDILYPVEISLEDSSSDLRWGMTVEITFPLDDED
jgi:HlyD family secretion protein